MEASESVLDAIFQETDIGGDEGVGGDDGEVEEGEDGEDVEMLDAEALAVCGGGTPAGSAKGGAPPSGAESGGNGTGPKESSNIRDKSKKKKKHKRKKKAGGGCVGAGSSIADLNRFVIETCRNLKEHKSYLLWNAIGCLGISTVKDLVKEVDVIQRCGGQKTVDGRRFRTGGGILWNILKTREPKTYKEIMTKGREFEKQFKVPKSRTAGNMQSSFESLSVPDGPPELLESSDSGANVKPQHESSNLKTNHQKVMDRVRFPVSYDDLLEDGEIRE